MKEINLDGVQLDFVPGKSTTNVTFLVKQLLDKHLVKNKLLYLTFVANEKAFYKASFFFSSCGRYGS